jgi:Mrp family chromosome partitioning ATPase
MTNQEIQNNQQTPEDCDSACSSCGVSDCAARSEDSILDKLATLPQTTIKHAIAIVSGKGGVGKSLVTSQLATALTKQGYKVGILDADITGPTMARAFGITEKLKGSDEGIIPQETPEGIKLVSTNLVLQDETTPVLWRGSIISNLVRQFWAEVVWGEIDYLLIDMPPGTGDVPLTIYQSLPIDGIVIVTAPQDLVSMIVSKAINMANMMEVPVLGIIENMSYFKCPDCGNEHAIFGKSSIDQLSSDYKIELSARVPIDPSYAGKMDAGQATQITIDSVVDFAGSLVAAVLKGCC